MSDWTAAGVEVHGALKMGPRVRVFSQLGIELPQIQVALRKRGSQFLRQQHLLDGVVGFVHASQQDAVMKVIIRIARVQGNGLEEVRLGLLEPQVDHFHHAAHEYGAVVPGIEGECCVEVAGGAVVVAGLVLVPADEEKTHTQRIKRVG